MVDGGYDYRENPQVAMVTWEDCESMEGWQEERDVLEYIERPLTKMKSVGWLICDNEKWVILAQSIDIDQDNDPKTGDLVKVPRPMIKAMWLLDKAPCSATTELPLGDFLKNNIQTRDWMPDGAVGLKDANGNLIINNLIASDGK